MTEREIAAGVERILASASGRITMKVTARVGGKGFTAKQTCLVCKEGSLAMLSPTPWTADEDRGFMGWLDAFAKIHAHDRDIVVS